MNIDSTLLGALIGGGFAVTGSICTAVAAYFTNKHGEHAKIRMKKKEDLYISLIELRESILLLGREFRSPSVTAQRILDGKNGFDSSRKKVIMIISLYFPSLDDRLEVLNKSLDLTKMDFIAVNADAFLEGTLSEVEGHNEKRESLIEIRKLLHHVSKLKI
ncbi:hypothetical protein [Serratia bockelmannii]|uniref:hypothetical protein n=1 Tax=Serratia bockelmannii TaxID=2703793 RepID=UPI003FA7D53D